MMCPILFTHLKFAFCADDFKVINLLSDCFTLQNNLDKLHDCLSEMNFSASIHQNTVIYVSFEMIIVFSAITTLIGLI